MATETSLKKWIRVFSISIAIITTRLPCLMQTNSCEAEFPTFISTFRKRKKISSYHVYVLQKTRYYGLFTWYRSDFRDEFRTRMKFVRKQARAFSLTWPASMQIYYNKRNYLHKKRVQLPQDCFGTPTWPPFIVLENQYGRRDVSLRSRRLEVTGTGKNRARESSRAAFNLAPFTSKRQPTVTSCENVLLS